jgi:hypothetical protein
MFVDMHCPKRHPLAEISFRLPINRFPRSTLSSSNVDPSWRIYFVFVEYIYFTLFFARWLSGLFLGTPSYVLYSMSRPNKQKQQPNNKKKIPQKNEIPSLDAMDCF